MSDVPEDNSSLQKAVAGGALQLIDAYRSYIEKGLRLCDPSPVELPGIEPATKSSLTRRNANVDDAKQREQT
jgi:hypothetical protein